MDTTRTRPHERTTPALPPAAGTGLGHLRRNGHPTHVRSLRRRAAELQATAWLLRTRHPLQVRAAPLAVAQQPLASRPVAQLPVAQLPV